MSISLLRLRFWFSRRSFWPIREESEFELVEAGVGEGRVCEFKLEVDLLRGNRQSQMELRG